MQQFYKCQRCLLTLGSIFAMMCIGCAEITIDEIPIEIDDQIPDTPENDFPADDGDGDSSDKGDNIDSDSNKQNDDKNSGSIIDDGKDTGKEDPKDDDSSIKNPPDSDDAAQDTDWEQDTEEEPVQDTETTPPDHNGGSDEDTEAGGGSSGYLCGTTPLLTSVTPNTQFQVVSALYGIAQSFKFVAPEVRAMEIVFSEAEEELGPHTIQLIEGEPGELNLIGAWEVDLPLDTEYFTSVCLPLGGLTFDTSKIYSITILPHKDTWSGGSFTVLGADPGTYPGGRAWYTDGSGVWYATTTDLHFSFY